ncbi:MAG: DUF2007 domain-containing protein [Chloroflexota bacterium]|nr:DUF2007 domain-containing protein [Chloroflexota bacterium]
MNEWEVVYTAYSQAEAQIVIGRLASENIRSWMQFESAGQAIGITVGVLGNVHVLVNPEDADRAIRILDNEDSDLLLDAGNDE